MLEKHRSNKLFKFLVRLLLFIFVFLLTQRLVDVNRPARVGIRKVDAIKIMSGSTEVFIRNQESIDSLLEQLKNKFVFPSIFNNEFNSEYAVLVFFKDSKVVGIFAYNTEKRLLHPGGKPLSTDLYDTLDSFIKQYFKPDKSL